jgi:hypothetical protein
MRTKQTIYRINSECVDFKLGNCLLIYIKGKTNCDAVYEDCERQRAKRC